MEAAAQVFSEKGLAGATTNKIAERAGVSIGTLYQYFPNKESLVHRLMDDHVKEGWEIISRELPKFEERKRLTPDIIRRMILTMVLLHKKDPALHRVLFEEIHWADFWPDYRKNEEFAVDALLTLMKRTEKRRREDAEPAVRLLVHAVEAMTHRFVLYGYNGLNEEDFINELTDMMTRYLLE